MLAFASLLKRFNKKVFLYSYDPVPYFLKFLPNTDDIQIVQNIENKFDVAVILECSEITRFGIAMNIRSQVKTTISIDHHVYKNHWADLNWFDHSSSSVSEMIYFVYKYLKLSLTKEEAECIYTGIVTDTHNFTQANTTSQSHIITSELLKCGVEPTKVEKFVYRTKPLNALKLLGLALDKIKTERSGNIAYTSLTLEDFDKTETTVEDTENIINYIGMLPDVKVWIIFRELSGKNTVKVGFRSLKDIDVNKISNKFGGGGHKNASGCVIKGSIKEAIKIIVDEVSRELE